MKLGPISFLTYFLLTMYATHPDVYNTYGIDLVEGGGGTPTASQTISRVTSPVVTSHSTARSGGGGSVSGGNGVSTSKPSQSGTKPNHSVATTYPNNGRNRATTTPQQVAIAHVNQPSNPTTTTTANVTTTNTNNNTGGGGGGGGGQTNTGASTPTPTPTSATLPSASPSASPAPAPVSSPASVPSPSPTPSTPSTPSTPPAPAPAPDPVQPASPIPSGATRAFYIDSVDGKDANSGTSSAAAWKTIAKINATVLKPGDYVLFKRGGIWREQLEITGSGVEGNPIVYDAYGTGPAPIITGSDVVTGWTNYSGNIYKTHISTIATPTQLYVDGTFYDTARYPQNGYLIATADSSDTTSIIDSDLNLPTDQIVGSVVMTRAINWNISANNAVAFDASSHKLTLDGNVYHAINMQKGYGFYLTNKLWMLGPGEWYYSRATGDLYVWTAQGDDPTNHTVEVSNRLYGIKDSSRNYITIQNLAIKNANINDVNLYNGKGLNVNNLTISGGQSAIVGTVIESSAITGNTVSSTMSDGIRVFNLPPVGGLIDISNNTVSHAGIVGRNPPVGIAGSIYAYGNTFTINSNQISYSGITGITFLTVQSTVRYNHVDHSCMLLQDCAGIYSTNRSIPGAVGGLIDSNTVTDSIGNNDGTPKLTEAHGIYLDDVAQGFTVTNNSVTNADFGYMVHAGHNNTFKNNYAYASRQNGFFISEDSNGTIPEEVKGVVHDNVVTNNVFETFSSSASGGIAYRYTGSQFRNGQFGDTLGFGTFDYNTYCHPYLPFAITERIVGKSMINYTLADWQKYSGQDMHSTDSSSTPCVAGAQAINTTDTQSFNFENMLGNVLNSIWWLITQY